VSNSFFKKLEVLYSKYNINVHQIQGKKVALYLDSFDDFLNFKKELRQIGCKYRNLDTRIDIFWWPTYYVKYLCAYSNKYSWLLTGNHVGTKVKTK
jgi:hypothetical protein